SSAPRRPISGLAPAPSPLVSLVPSWIFTGARDICSACRSVFATMNSTPSTPAQIMRLTAFPPPPPTPITLIFALFFGSSLNWIRTSPFFFSSLIHHTPAPVQTFRRQGACLPCRQVSCPLAPGGHADPPTPQPKLVLKSRTRVLLRVRDRYLLSMPNFNSTQSFSWP